MDSISQPHVSHHDAAQSILSTTSYEDTVKCRYTIANFFVSVNREGNSSLVDEIAEVLPAAPDLLVLSVGGGGLLCGVVRGLDRVGWNDVPILAMETDGANSLDAAISAGKIVSLPAITR